MLIWLYRLAFLPGLLIAGPYYWWRMRRRGGYRGALRQRLGFGLDDPDAPDGVLRIWIHAVSVGELLGVEPLMRRLSADGARILLTVTTSTARALAEERFRGLAATISYFPLDAWPCSAAAWRAHRPDLMLLMEGELWPEHLWQGRARGVPVVRINARLSDRSFRRMRRVLPLAAWLLRLPAWTLCSGEQDRNRLIQVGADPDRTRVTGSLKVDAPLGEPLESCARLDLLEQLGFDDAPVLVGASTWEGEEAVLIEALQVMRRAGQACNLLLVPRHAERAEALRSLLKATGLRTHFRSAGNAPGPVDVCVADTTGELKRLLQVGAVVFVGKSLPPHREGQTPIEAAGHGIPVVFGPGMANFRSVAAELVACGAAVQAGDAQSAVTLIGVLFADPRRRQAMSAAGRDWHIRNRGALEKTLDLLENEVLKGRFHG
jgi:3-deoxy-D-manno-octulosonic-acid transferase